MILPVDDFLKLRETLPLADVRSPKEFSEGHMRKAINIPILNDEERIAVGTDYKKKGSLEAIKTGFRLVGPRFLDIVNQAEAAAGGRDLLVHCWRGGMRSTNFCSIVGMAKIKTIQLQGGYKAYREMALESYRKPMKIQIIGGFTGSGKSEVLMALKKRGEQVLDLEKMASHKGSVFGGLMMPPQPTTEQFQNELFEELIAMDLSRRIWVEDESIAIGKIFLPEKFWRQMSAAPVFDVSASKDARIARLVREYGNAEKNEFLAAMESISKKLGGQHFNSARERLFEGDMASTIEILLHYYDKAYDVGLKKKNDRIRARISWNGIDADECAKQLVNS